MPSSISLMFSRIQAAGRHVFLVLGLMLVAQTLFAATEDELLEPEKAFRYSAQLIDPNTVEARFQIASGYYLYRDKTRFSAEGVKLGSAQLPPGKIKQDEFFGRVETYTGDLRVRIPVPDGVDRPFTLKVAYQGCAEVGVCYPPLEASVQVNPVSGGASGGMQTQSSDLINRLREMAGGLGGEPEYLSAEEAFKVAVKALPDNRFEARFEIAKGHYLYRDQTRFAVQNPEGVTITDLELPKAKEKDDPYFGRTFIYPASFTVTGRLIGVPEGVEQVALRVDWQGCSEKGICYPPSDQIFMVAVRPTDSNADLATTETAPATPAAAPVDTSESGRIAALLQGGSFWLVVATFFGFGLLLSLTPCVFPMIPILSGIIVGQNRGQGLTKRRGFMLSLAYVLGMAITYALAGVLAGLSGTLISNALQNPVALGVGAALFVALALSMFGFYELQLPSFLQSRFTEASNRIRGGNLIGVFIMGVISALIVGPCVAAPLAGALLYIGQSGDVVLGGVSLFFLALGMGVPLLLVGLSAGALLPRAGAWMDAVKKFFGVLMLAVAIWLISPLISDILYMLLWAALLVISAIYLKALEPLAVNASGWIRFWKGVGVLSLVAGIALLLGAMGGSRDVLQPLAVFQGGIGGGNAVQKGLDFRYVRSEAELDAALAESNGRYVMLDFYADWCVSCKEMERFTFSDPAVQARLADVVLLKADVTGNTAEDKALLKRFRLFGPPGIIFFDRAGKEQGFRVIGFEPADKFMQSLDQAMPR